MSEANSPRDALDATVVDALHRLVRTPWELRALACAAMTVGALALDWWSGPTMSVLLGYAITVPMIAWLFGPRWPAVGAALLLAVASAILVVAAHDNVVASHIVIANATFRAGSLAVLAVIVSAFRRHLLETERLAGLDSLTGVGSRHAILAELDDAIARSHQLGQPTSVVYFDLDGLKEVNDKQGHRAGDDLIRRFASCVRAGLRDSDHFGRIGGDEFLLVCSATNADEAAQLVDRIGSYAEIPAFSWGVATTEPDIDVASLVARADAAMYEIKHNDSARSSARSAMASTQPDDLLAGGHGPLLPSRYESTVRTHRPGGWFIRPRRRTGL